MQFSNLRELLLKRTTDENLRSLIKLAGDDVIEEMVLESLRKDSNRVSSHNHAIMGLAGHTLPHSSEDHPHDSLTAALVHDNLSHHLTHYKSALKAGDRSTADQHLNQVMRTLRLADKVGSAAGGDQLRIRSASTAKKEGQEGSHLISMSPWEMRHTGSNRHAPNKPGGVGKFRQDQQGLKLEVGSGKKKTPDYQFLEMSPHPHNKKVDTFGHDDSAYPFHDITVNGRHVVIEDTPHSGKFEPHAFDSHPAMKHAYSLSSSSSNDSAMTHDHARQFANEHKDWMNGPELDKWIKDQEAKHESDPNYSNRGTVKSNPVLDKPTESTWHLGHGRRDLTPGETSDSALWPNAASQPSSPQSDPNLFTLDLNAPEGKLTAETPSTQLHPTTVAIIKKLAPKMSPEQISATLGDGLTPEQVKTVLGGK